MARRDVIRYYFDQESAYLELKQTVKDIEDDYKNGLISKEKYETLIDQGSMDIGTVRDNYERIAYIIMLLNKPHRNEKRRKEEKDNDYIYKYLDGNTLEDINLENTNALKHLKQLAKESRNDH